MEIVYFNLFLIPLTAFIAGATSDRFTRYVHMFITAVNVGIVLAELAGL
jgi:hypothetical protein